ncbi:MAG: sterol desaturase family protein [Bacteroidetes bacterium]|nr:sterol desaturase family protein [Bacteroidota bacterium]
MKVDYIALSIPIFFLLIGIELLYGVIKKVKLYRLNDSITNISLGIGQQVTGVFMKTALFFGYLYLYENYRIMTLESTILVWILLFIGVDFFYYWFHRLSHEVNAMWAAHIVHHQSEDYNLSVALRQSWLQSAFSWVFYLPLAILGFEPVMFLTISAFNTLYQFWIHTRLIKKMGPLELILNTPSHHRVHHGSDPKYIDKNHAGTLIIWDRMFGTFQQEEEEPHYGITTPLNSWNPVWANMHYWKDLVDESRQAKGIKDKMLVFLKPPGWFPAYLGGFKAPKEIDETQYFKYDTKTFKAIHGYILFQFTIVLGVATLFLFNQQNMNWYQSLAVALLLIFSLLIFGQFFENRKHGVQLELLRLLSMIPVALLFMKESFFTTLLPVTLVLVVISLITIQLILESTFRTKNRTI